VGVFAAGDVCYQDNSKLRASIFTKLGLSVQVVTISIWLNFGGPTQKVVCSGGKFWLCLTAIADSVRLWGTVAGAQCLCLSERFFIFIRVPYLRELEEKQFI